MRILLVLIATACIGFGGIVGCITEQKGKPVVVFDFGGVMAEFDLRQMFEYCADALDMPIGELKKAIKEEEFWIQLANKNDLTLPPKERTVWGIHQEVDPAQTGDVSFS